MFTFPSWERCRRQGCTASFQVYVEEQPRMTRSPCCDGLAQSHPLRHVRPEGPIPAQVRPHHSLLIVASDQVLLGVAIVAGAVYALKYTGKDSLCGLRNCYPARY